MYKRQLIDKLRHFHYEDVEVPNGLIENSGRELNASYQEKLIGRVVGRYAPRIFLPYPIRACWTTVKSLSLIHILCAAEYKDDGKVVGCAAGHQGHL